MVVNKIPSKFWKNHCVEKPPDTDNINGENLEFKVAYPKKILKSPPYTRNCNSISSSLKPFVTDNNYIYMYVAHQLR